MTDGLDILVQLAFDANEEGLAEVNKFLINEGNIIKELENKVTQLNKTIGDGTQRSVQENVKLVDQLNKTRTQYDAVTTAVQQNQTALISQQNQAMSNAAAAKVLGDAALEDLNKQIALTKELGRTQIQTAAARPAGDGVVSQDPARLKLFVSRVNEQSIAMRNAALATRNYQASLDQLRGSSNRADLALINLGRIVQDAPYGFLGISNNLNPMLESFQRLQKETGSTGGALKSMIASLSGAQGLGIAISVVSSLLVVFGDKLFHTSAAAVETQKSVDDLTKSLVSEAQAYAELTTKNDEYATTLQLETDLLRARGVERDQLSKSENENLVQDAKDLSAKNEQLTAQKQILQDITNVIRLKPTGQTLAQYFESAGFSLQKFNSYAVKYRDQAFLNGISKDIAKVEKDGGNVVNALYAQMNTLDNQIQINANKTQVKQVETVAHTADRQYQTTKSLNNDIFNLEKELIDKKAEANQTQNENDLRAKEAVVLANQAAAIREVELAEKLYQKQNSADIRINLEAEQKKTANAITEQQKRITSLKGVSDGGTTSQIDIYAEQNTLLQLQNKFSAREKAINDFRDQDATNEGKFAKKRALINEIANDELVALRRAQNKKLLEIITKYYEDLAGIEKSETARTLALYQKEDEDTLGVRMRALQIEANETHVTTQKKYADLFAIAKKAGLDTLQLQKDYEAEQALDENENTIKQLDALSAYFKDRSKVIQDNYNLQVAQDKLNSNNEGQLQIKLAQDNLVKLNEDLKLKQKEYGSVIDQALGDTSSDPEIYGAKIKQLQIDLANLKGDIKKTQQEILSLQVKYVEAQAAQFNDLVQQVGNAANTVLDIEKSKNDALIAEQQRRVDATQKIADQGNAVLLKAEQDRLDALTAKQQKYAQDQKAINAVMIISQSALNVVRAIGAVIEASDKKNVVSFVVSIAAAVAAVAAGIGATIAAVKKENTGAGGFYKGGFTGDGADHAEAGIVHKNEFVMDAKTTRRFGRQTFEQLRKGNKKIVDVDYLGMSKDISHVRQNDYAKQYDWSRMEGKLDIVAQAIEDKPVSTMYADSRGFTEHIVTSQHHFNKMKKL